MTSPTGSGIKNWSGNNSTNKKAEFGEKELCFFYSTNVKFFQ
jgi:hypothetical protein